MTYGLNTRKPAAQDWTIGATVRCGFMSLTVKAALSSGAHILANAAGTQLYIQRPHNGCEKIGPVEAAALMAEHEEAAARATYRALAKAGEDARKAAAINALFA